MNEEYFEIFPAWVSCREKNYKLILSNDIDSLAACTLLEQQTNWRTEAVMLHKYNRYAVEHYDQQPFDFFGTLNPDFKLNQCVGVDLALMNGKCFDNHVQLPDKYSLANPRSANLNTLHRINCEEYHKKYAGSTFLLVWALYGYPDDNLSDDMNMFRACVDSAYLGYFSQDFKKYMKEYLVDILEMPCLYDFLGNHSKKEFENFQKRYGLKRCIFRREDTGYLNTYINLDEINRIFRGSKINLNLKLPDGQFEKRFLCRNMKSSSMPVEKNIFTMSITKKNEFKYSIPFGEGKEFYETNAA